MPDPMNIRRVVTGHDSSGKAVVLYDGTPPVSMASGADNGFAILWKSDTTPVDNSGSEDAGNADNLPIPPVANGNICRIVEFIPVAGHDTSGEQDFLKSRGATVPDDPRDPGMHKTDSVDYAFVLSGEIDMLLDDSEVHLTAGDVVIQRGTYHAWVNRGTEPCRIAFVLIGADPAP